MFDGLFAGGTPACAVFTGDVTPGCAFTVVVPPAVAEEGEDEEVPGFAKLTGSDGLAPGFSS